MFEVTLISILCSILAYFACRLNVRNPLLVPLMILALFFSLRYNYTQDYSAYSRLFSQLNAYENLEYFRGVRYLEPGWKILNRLCRPFGFQFLVALTTFLQFGTFGWFAHKYVPHKWEWVLMLFYVFDPKMALLQLSAMRQTVAMCVIMWSMPWILDRKILKASVMWLLALSFHRSAYIAFPIIFAGYLKPKWWFWVVIVEGSLVIIATALPTFFLSLAEDSIEMVGVGHYAHYLAFDKGLKMGTGLGIAYKILFLSYMFYLMRKTDRQMFIFASIFQISWAFQLLGLAGQYFGRFGWYFTFLGIPAYLLYIKNWKRSLIDRTIFVVYVLIQIYTYYMFFTDYFPEGYLHYRTILDF